MTWATQKRSPAGELSELKTLGRESLTKRATDSIREAILVGTYKLGERLREAELARKLGVSNNVIRESLHALEGEGAVVSIPYCGRCVFSITTEQAQELRIVRASLESYVAELAARKMSAAAAQKIQAAAERFSGETARTYSGWVDLELGFHRAVWEAAKNPLLVNQLNQLAVPLFSMSTYQLFRPNLDLRMIVDNVPAFEGSGNMQGHKSLAEAILSGDPVVSRDAMRRHILPVRDVMGHQIAIPPGEVEV